MCVFKRRDKCPKNAFKEKGGGLPADGKHSPKTALLAQTTAGERMVVAEQRNNRCTRRRWARMRLETVWVALPDTHKQDHHKSTVAEPVIRQRANL